MSCSRFYIGTPDFRQQQKLLPTSVLPSTRLYQERSLCTNIYVWPSFLLVGGFLLYEEIISHLKLLVYCGHTVTCRELLCILYSSESKQTQTEQPLRQCRVRNNSLCSVVTFYARDAFLETSHKSNLALFKTNLPIGINGK
jgi:hypothetical protein